MVQTEVGKHYMAILIVLPYNAQPPRLAHVITTLPFQSWCININNALVITLVIKNTFPPDS